MFIKSIFIAKYRHLENITIGPFLPPQQPSDVIVLAGPNGSGKSSVLELVSKALSSMWTLTYSLNRTAPDSSFEVTIGLLPEEIATIEKHYQTVPANPTTSSAISFLKTNKQYYRSFNYPQGEYEKNKSLQNTIHSMITTALRGDWLIPLGFQLGSERSYQKKAFVRENLFKYDTYSSTKHTWGFAFQSSAQQYEDMFDFLVTWRFYFLQELGSYHQRKDLGLLKPNEKPPADYYGDILKLVFPGYQFVEKLGNAPTDLFIRIPSGEEIPFSDLSSGEKEVFFTLCFFQRHKVEKAVIVIDEPELHLHPSLSRILLRTMMKLKPNNQLWLATQSPEIIDEAGRDKTFFIQRHDTTKKAVIINATDEEPALSCLRDFFGYSGYIGLARSMVFSEGRNSSVDRKMLARLFPALHKEVKIIPATGCSEVQRINKAILSIITANIGWCNFFLIRDKDYMPDTVATTQRQRGDGKLFVLNRHEIENYLLEFDLISSVLDDIFGLQIGPDETRTRLHKIACSISGNVLRDMVSYRLNLIYRAEDFSIGRFLENQLSFEPGQGWKTVNEKQLKDELVSKSDIIAKEASAKITGINLNTLYDECRTQIEAALSGTDWLSLFPGKEMLNIFAKQLANVSQPALQNAIIVALSSKPDRIASDLKEILDKIK